jgi:hypothetical protein
VTEEARLVVRDSCDLLNFYFFILWLLKEGEVEGLVCDVDVGVDEVQVAGHLGQKVTPRTLLKGLA